MTKNNTINRSCNKVFITASNFKANSNGLNSQHSHS